MTGQPIQYLLPCEACGKSLKVETRHAGAELPCECGAEVQVPSLMQVKKLEPATETPDVASTGKMTVQQKTRLCLVLLGGFLAAIFLCTYLVWQANFRPTLQDAVMQQTEFKYGGNKVYQNFAPISQSEAIMATADDEYIDSLNPIEAYGVWKYMESTPIASVSLQERFNQLARFHFYVGVIFLVMIVVGLSIMASALLIVDPKPPQGKRPGKGVNSTWGNS